MLRDAPPFFVEDWMTGLPVDDVDNGCLAVPSRPARSVWNAFVMMRERGIVGIAPRSEFVCPIWQGGESPLHVMVESERVYGIYVATTLDL